MNCFVYKGVNKEDHFLYLPEELTDRLAGELPAGLLSLLGGLNLVVSFELTAGKYLAQADPAQVMEDMLAQGYFLQMPKKDMLLEEDRFFN